MQDVFTVCTVESTRKHYKRLFILAIGVSYRKMIHFMTIKITFLKNLQTKQILLSLKLWLMLILLISLMLQQKLPKIKLH